MSRRKSSKRSPSNVNQSLHRFADWLDSWHLVRILSALSSVGIIIAVIAVIGDLQGRHESRIAQAWEIVNRKAAGNSGKVQALEYLNSRSWPFKQRVPLVGIDLSSKAMGGQVWLRGIDLSGADLTRSKFDGADLMGARFRGARLIGTTFNTADISGADFTRAKILNATFVSALIPQTIWKDAVVVGVDFTDAGINLIYDAEPDRWPDFSNVEISISNLEGFDFTFSKIINAKIEWSAIADARFPEPNAANGLKMVNAWAWRNRPPSVWINDHEQQKKLPDGILLCDTKLKSEWKSAKKARLMEDELVWFGIPPSCDPDLRQWNK